MKKIIFTALFFTSSLGFAQQPQTVPQQSKDTSKQQETPVKITPQQMDIEPVKKEKSPKAEITKKEIPSEGPKKRPKKEIKIE